uniref:Methyltransf_21 domain-containing protein n=1 Tax=Caenorhabditis tropicalis TaxID=1561998 RepID=A0A1I7SXP1_9PELO
MYHSTNSGSLSILLLFIILLFTISNYFTFHKIEIALGSTSHSNPLEIYNSDSMKELRRQAFQSAQNDRKSLWNSSRQANNKEFFGRVKIEAHCEHKERIGEKGDGGKYVCNPKMVRKDCTLLSLGLNNQIGYDKHIYEATGRQCTILGADVSAQNEQTKQSYDIMGGRLFVGKIPESISIPQMLQKAGRRDVELLKIDIEKGEFTAVEPLIKDYFVCQIFIEIHGTPSDHYRLLQTMSGYGFRIFNVEENIYCPTCCEYSLINELCMPQFGVIPLATIISPVHE